MIDDVTDMPSNKKSGMFRPTNNASLGRCVLDRIGVFLT